MKRRKCDGLIGYETIGVILVVRDGRYNWRCPSCGASGSVARIKTSTRCGRLVPVPVSPV